MSDPEFNPPKVHRLEELGSKKDAILSTLQSGEITDLNIKSAYESAMGLIEAEASVLGTDPDVQRYYVFTAAEAERSLEQLKPLEGILPEEEISGLRDDYSARFTNVAELLRSYGPVIPEAREIIKRSPLSLATSTTTEIVPVTEDTTDAPNESMAGQAIDSAERREPSKANVPIRIGDKFVLLGRQEKPILLNKAKKADFRDYSIMRQAGLKYLIEHQDQEFTPYDMWSAISDTEFKGAAFHQIAIWLKKLQFRRQPLMVSNSKRGVGSRYKSNPSLILTLIESKRPTPETEDDERQIRGDLYVAAMQLEQFNPILKDRGCGEIELSILEKLRIFQPDYSHIKGNAQAIYDAREASLARITVFLNDNERFDTFLSQTDGEAPDYKFLEYLFDLEDDQRRLINRLMRAKIEREIVSPDEIRFWAVDINDRDNVIATTNVIIRQPSQLTQVEEGADSPRILQPEQVIVVPRETNNEDEEITELPSEPCLLGERGKSSRLSISEKAKLNRVRSEADAIATSYINSGLSPSKSYKRTEIQAVLPKFTSKAVREAAESGILHREGSRHLVFDIRSVLTVILYNDGGIQNTIRTRKYKSVIESIKTQAIESAIKVKELSSAAGDN